MTLSEHNTLKLKISNLLEENKRLSKELNDLLESKEKTDVFYTHDQSDLIENLKGQINALISEKEYSTKLWQNSIKTIDLLEDELKVFQAGTQEFIPKKDFVEVSC
ncbi:hypothetical protein NQ314_020458 [Rhamnusium bicolor]|uniref:Uncharacterized protein n=1 Tax=Rhamnusium bicolor TaxID=1586634 RepID=A0AAV8WKS6_9CUCU|nr:hypothetical protein NQ314_020458 [Rhamnusium bicolor]